MKNKSFLSTFLSVFALFTVVLGSTLGLLIYKSSKLLSRTIKDTVGGEKEAAAEQRDRIFRLLILGVDEVGNNCDTIILASLDADTGEAYFLQIPRDTYINEKGCSFHKINSYFAACYNDALSEGKSAQSARQSAAADFTSFVSRALCVDIERYLLADLAGVARIVDSVGPLKIRVPCDLVYDDEAQGLHINIKKGLRSLDGEEVCSFMRARNAYLSADYGRMDAQKLVFASLFSHLTENRDASTVMRFARAVFENCTTNLSLPEALPICISARGLSAEKVFFCTLVGKNVSAGGSFEVLNLNRAVGIINRFKLARHDIDREQIDSAGVFTDRENALINDAYKSNELYSPDIYSAKALKNEGINIK